MTVEVNEILSAIVTIEYKCLECGRTEGVHKKVDGLGLRRLKTHGAPAADMPFHWASYTNGFRCPKHVK